MNKVIRSPKISEQRVRIIVESVTDDVFVGEGSEEDSENLEEHTDQEESTEDSDTSEMDEAVEAAMAVEAIEAEKEGQEDSSSEEEVEETDVYSAVEVEAMVEERLKEFEERFQQEKESAYRSGFEDGKTEGLREGQAQSVSEIDRFRGIVEQVRTHWDELFKGSELELAELSLALARNIVGELAVLETATVLEAVRDCFENLQDKSAVSIRVHPDDLETVERERTGWTAALDEGATLKIEEDPNIERGGCVVDTSMGAINAQIEDRFERLRTVVTEAIRNKEAEQPDLGVAELESLQSSETDADPSTPNAEDGNPVELQGGEASEKNPMTEEPVQDSPGSTGTDPVESSRTEEVEPAQEDSEQGQLDETNENIQVSPPESDAGNGSDESEQDDVGKNE